MFCLRRNSGNFEKFVGEYLVVSYESRRHAWMLLFNMVPHNDFIHQFFLRGTPFLIVTFSAG